MIKKKPYFLLLFASVILLSLAFVVVSEPVDINVYDVYFVLQQDHLYGLFSAMLFFLFLTYFVLNKIGLPLVKALDWVHICATLFFTVAVFLPYSLFFYTSDFFLTDSYEKSNTYISISLLLFFIVQILFIINIFVAAIKKLRT